MTREVTIEVKYADGRTREEIHTIEGGAVVSKKVVKRAEPQNGGTVAVDYPEGEVEAYCMKCKGKTSVVDPKSVAISGRNAIQGTCSKCGTKVFKFVKGKGGEKKVAARKKVSEKTEGKPEGLSAKASRAYNKLEKEGLLEDCWCGVTDGGSAVWWSGDSEKGWTLCMDPIQNDDEASFKKLVVASL